MQRKTGESLEEAARFEPARWGWLGLGGLAFALGAVGLAVPLMPTTIFWIAAAFCFSRSSPALRDRIYAHPRFGRTIENFLRHGVVSRKAKRAATAGIILGYATLAAVAAPDWRVLVGLGVLLGGVVVWIRTRPADRSTRKGAIQE